MVCPHCGGRCFPDYDHDVTCLNCGRSPIPVLAPTVLARQAYQTRRSARSDDESERSH
jgi:hypothetical protein